MSVYVDSLMAYESWVKGHSHINRWCHMVADTMDELHQMANSIGLKRSYFQKKASFPHYDLSSVKRKMAVARGAKEIDRRQIVKFMQEKRKATSGS